MKRLTTLLIIAAITSMGSLNSCHKADSLALFFYLTYGGATHNFSSNLNMYVYQSYNYTQITGTESSTGDQISGYLSGITAPHTYSMGGISIDNFQLKKGSNTYSTTPQFGWGSLGVTSMDNSKMYAQGTFNGNLVNTGNSADSIPIINATFAIKYQF